MAKKKTCFVIAPIGDDESETRKRSDQILKHVISPPLDECGYKAVRADKIEKPGVITSQVIQHVVEDPLVIADLTGRNPNVFYELAIRHAIRKPFIQIIQKGERIPFDIAGTRTIYIDHRDLDSVGQAKNEIKSQIKTLEEDASQIETPISVSLDLQLLRKSDDPEQRSLADIMAALTDLPSRIEQRFLERGEPVHKRKFRRIHPMMIEDITHMVTRESRQPIAILLLAGLLREEIPLLSEVAMELYRVVKSGTREEIEESLRVFQHLTDIFMHGPMAEELGMFSKESRMLLHELPMFMSHNVRRYLAERKPVPIKKKLIKKKTKKLVKKAKRS
ncbi:MAG: hypothetical protein PHQ35_02295 [Phycisphaerae bacterium]|nr:hypothetical protein [Phycisphaerae bacterium]MDD5380475.1 hypothetical protein [Phycisphaerae bacterium]